MKQINVNGKIKVEELNFDFNGALTWYVNPYDGSKKGFHFGGFVSAALGDLPLALASITRSFAVSLEEDNEKDPLFPSIEAFLSSKYTCSKGIQVYLNSWNDPLDGKRVEIRATKLIPFFEYSKEELEKQEERRKEEEAQRFDCLRQLPTWNGGKQTYELCICICVEKGLSVKEMDDIVREFERRGKKIITSGHINSTGGYCCPHYGDTCGAHNY